MQYNGLKYFAKRSKKLYCYGIGKWGECVAKYCKRNHIEITAYIVTKPLEGQKEFYGKPLVCIMDTTLTKRDGIIIATEKEEYKKDMVRALENIPPKRLYYIEKKSSVVRYYYSRFKKRSRLRKKISIFNAYALAQPIPIYAIIRDLDSRWTYGINRYIRKYTRKSNYDLDNCTVQHGIAFGGVSVDYSNPPDGNIFSMAGIEWERLNNFKIYCMGPYIRYASSIISNKKLEEIKMRQGKTLLVFPMHASGNDLFDVQYSEKEFIDEIERIRKQGRYDSVVVCLYFANILRGDIKRYRDFGYKIVTAGYYVDQFFIDRLKSILLLSDSVITNGLGTHIGYAVCLNKPVYLYTMKINNKNERDIEAGIYKIINPYEEYLKNVSTVTKAFNKYRTYITEEQIEIVKKFWGDWHCRKGLKLYKRK